MIAILAAMDREARGLTNGMSPAARGAIELRVTGVGKDRAKGSMAALLDQGVRPEAILSIGFAGALNESLRSGDVVLSRRLHATEEDEVFEADAHLLSETEKALGASPSPRHFVADNLTVPRMVTQAAEKGRLARASAAWVINMEDYWIGQATAGHGVPFLSVRVVLDTAHQEIPTAVLRLGEMGPIRQVLHLVTRPWNFFKIVHLASQARIAQGSLAAFGASLVAGESPARSYAPH